MNKFIKCWVFIICLLFIFLILFTDRVNAETCQGDYLSNLGGKSKSQSLTLGTNVVDLSTDMYTLDNHYNTFYLYLFNGITTTSGLNYSSIDLTTTCSHQTNYWSTPTNQPYIRYMDGTTANIVDYQNIVNLCDTYNNSGTITSPVSYEPNISNINVILRNSQNGYQEICEYNRDNGIAKCPYIASFDTIRFQVVLEKSNSASFKIMTLSGYYKRCVNDTQQIINNQNQNAQQQHQDSQTINNSITSDDVNGNNSNSSITSIGNTFDTQGDFLLNLLTIPYNLWTSIINAIGGTCSPIDVGTIFGEHLVFPCINLNSLLGGVWTTIIDVIFTGMIYSAFIRRVIKYFRELLTLDPQALETGGVKIW